MPLYGYECNYCGYEFEEINKYNDSGKTWCPKCGNVAFKTIQIARPIIFKPREFANGTKTPPHVRTYKQEKEWKKKEGLTYDRPTGKERQHRQEERKIKTETNMKKAFDKALDEKNLRDKGGA